MRDGAFMHTCNVVSYFTKFELLLNIVNENHQKWYQNCPSEFRVISANNISCTKRAMPSLMCILHSCMQENTAIAQTKKKASTGRHNSRESCALGDLHQLQSVTG
ncbi:unnamed protein product [Ixodes pacificus]